jgi:hypothetical protein
VDTASNTIIADWQSWPLHTAFTDVISPTLVPASNGEGVRASGVDRHTVDR